MFGRPRSPSSKALICWQIGRPTTKIWRTRLRRSTDTSEGGLETLIVAALTGAAPVRAPSTPGYAEEVASFTGPDDYIEGHRDDFDRVHALDLVQLAAFLHATQ